MSGSVDTSVNTPEAGENTSAVEAPSYLSMSDEELMNAAPPEFKAPAAQVSEEASETTPAAETTAETGEEPAEEAADAGESKEKDPAADAGEAAEKAEGEEAKKPEAEKEEPKVEPVATDYEAEYKRLLAPFKANGREIQVKSVDDAIALMQMGANYNKKMAALKPNLQLMKMLENNGLLSEEKLSFLIDLDKKNPDAINKLVKDAGINPLDLDGEKAGDYKPKTHAVDEREVELDTILEELQETPTYNQLIQLVAKEWDGNSKQAIAQEPQLLKVLNDHMARGIYDRIRTEVESERMFGRLSGMSDLEAYKSVGDAIQARGGFNDLVDKPTSESQPSPKTVVEPPKKKVEDPKLNEKRRAAGPTKTAAPSTPGLSDLNPLSMSDADFAKMATPVYR
jgi:hypothetical protein